MRGSSRNRRRGRVEEIQVRNNLIITVRERGKIVARREGHNIWLNLGSEYLASLITYASFGPAVPERNDRVQYVGFGIGGNRQLQLAQANASPLVTAYPGTNVQTDIDPSIVGLERPVRFTGSSDPYPGQGADVWLGQVGAPVVHGTSRESTFSRLISQSDISYAPFSMVPLSEIALFTAAANPNIYNNNAIAYDTFDTLSKTIAFEFEVQWTVRF